MDDIDRRILSVLQRDASKPLGEIAEAAGLSPTPCWRRIKKLEEEGVIAGRVALIDAASVNLALSAFVSVKAARHDKAWLDRFADHVTTIPEIIEVHRLSGDTDYMLKIVCRDIAHYDRIYKRLIAGAEFADVSSTFSMEQLKSTTELPLDYA